MSWYGNTSCTPSSTATTVQQVPSGPRSLPSQSGGLALTGFNVAAVVLLAVVLILAGAVLVRRARRR